MAKRVSMQRRDSSLEVLQRANQRIQEPPARRESTKEEDISRYLSSMRRQTNVSSTMGKISDISDISISEDDSNKKPKQKKSYLKPKKKPSTTAPSVSSNLPGDGKGRSQQNMVGSIENAALLKANALLSSYEKKHSKDIPSKTRRDSPKSSKRSQKSRSPSGSGKDFHLSLSSGSEKSAGAKPQTPPETQRSSSSRRSSSRSDSIDKKLYSSHWDTPLDYMDDKDTANIGKGGAKFLKKKNPPAKATEPDHGQQHHAKKASPKTEERSQKPIKSTLRTPRTPPSPKKRVTIDDAFYNATSSISETSSLPVILRSIEDIEDLDDDDSDPGPNIHTNIILDAGDLDSVAESDSEKKTKGDGIKTKREERFLEISDYEDEQPVPTPKPPSVPNPKAAPRSSPSPLSTPSTPKRPTSSRPVSTELEYTEEFEEPSEVLSVEESQSSSLASVPSDSQLSRSRSASSDSSTLKQRSSSASSTSSSGKGHSRRRRRHSVDTLSSTSTSLTSSDSSSRRGRGRRKKKSHKDKKTRSKSPKRGKTHKTAFPWAWDHNPDVEAGLLKGLEAALEYKDPMPVSSGVVGPETLKAVTTQNPMMIALNNLLRQQLTMSQSFLLKQRAIYHHLVSDMQLGSTRPHTSYTTLEATKKYIRKHRPKSMSYKEALKEVEREMRHH